MLRVVSSIVLLLSAVACAAPDLPTAAERRPLGPTERFFSGRTLDLVGSPVAGVSLHLSSNGKRYSTTSRRDGTFELPVDTAGGSLPQLSVSPPSTFHVPAWWPNPRPIHLLPFDAPNRWTVWLAGSDSVTHTPPPVRDRSPLQTDTTVYHLRYEPEVFRIQLRVEYANRTGASVYFHRACGYGDEPSRQLIRVDGDTTRVALGQQVCITAPLRKPIEVARGQTFVDEFVLESSESPYAYPPVTASQRTGTFRLVYGIQGTSRSEGWTATDLLPLEQRQSNVFLVRLPL